MDPKSQSGMAAEAFAGLAGDFADLAQAFWAQESEAAVLSMVSRSAVATVPGAAAASITFRRNSDCWETATPTASVADVADQAQYEAGEGPCVDTVRFGRTHIANDLAAETRWPAFCRVALDQGLAGVLSIDLHVSDQVLGALNIYAVQPGAFGRRSEVIGRIHATHAALAIAWSRQSEALQQEVHARAVLGEAVGVLMERHRLTSADALRRLQQAAKEHGLSLLEAAQRVTSSDSAA